MVRLSAGEVTVQCMSCQRVMKHEMATRFHNMYCVQKIVWKTAVKQRNEKLADKTTKRIIRMNDRCARY